MVSLTQTVELNQGRRAFWAVSGSILLPCRLGCGACGICRPRKRQWNWQAAERRLDFIAMPMRIDDDGNDNHGDNDSGGNDSGDDGDDGDDGGDDDDDDDDEPCLQNTIAVDFVQSCRVSKLRSEPMLLRSVLRGGGLV